MRHADLRSSALHLLLLFCGLVAACSDEPSGEDPPDTADADVADQEDVTPSDATTDTTTGTDASDDTADAPPDSTAADTEMDVAADTEMDTGPTGPISGPSIVLTIYETQPEDDTIVGLFTPDNQGFEQVAMCWGSSLCFETWPAAGQSADFLASGSLDPGGLHTFLDVGPSMTFGGIEATLAPDFFPPVYLGRGKVAEGLELGLTLGGGVLGDYLSSAALQRPAALRLLEPIPTDFWDVSRPPDGQVTLRWEPGGPGEVYLLAFVRTYTWLETAQGRLFHFEDTGTYTLDIASLPNMDHLTPSATPVDDVQLLFFRMTTTTVDINDVEIQLTAIAAARWNFGIDTSGN